MYFFSWGGNKIVGLLSKEILNHQTTISKMDHTGFNLVSGKHPTACLRVSALNTYLFRQSC